MTAALTAGPPSVAAWAAVAEATAVGTGIELLDIGCGAGEFCALAAARGASVHGLDAAPVAIDHARRAVPDGDFQVGLMEDLPWPDASFDVVTGFNSFQYALDIDAALGEAQRVSRAGGRLAICKWGRPEDNEFFALLIALGAGRRESLRATDPVEEAVRRAGLAVCDTGEVAVAMEMADAAALESALISAGALRGPCDQPQRRRLLAIAARCRRPGGSYRFISRLRYLVATT
jgi:SAM-dependent methyltransferase